MKRFYLSEMAVSDRHGGGLTLKRILREDLQRIECFVHVDRFATEFAPIASEFAGRQLNLHLLHRQPLPPSPPRDYLERVLARARIKTPFTRALDRWSKQAGDHLLQQLQPAPGRWLVVPQNRPSVLVMNRVVRQQPVDYVTWIMDDHVVRWRNGWYYPPGFEAEFGFHLRQARRVAVISPTLQAFYQTRFGVKSEILFGSTDTVGDAVSAQPGEPLRLAYFGAIREWQRDALALLAAHLNEFNGTLDLYGLQAPPPEIQSPAVKVLPPIPAAEVPGRMREYDGVVIAASFERDLRHLTEFNIATKLSECLGSGTATIVVAPAYSAMAQFCQQHGGAVVVSDFSDSRSQNALRQLKSSGFRAELLAAARRTVETQCSAAIMRRRWEQVWN